MNRISIMLKPVGFAPPRLMNNKQKRGQQHDDKNLHGRQIQPAAAVNGSEQERKNRWIGPRREYGQRRIVDVSGLSIRPTFDNVFGVVYIETEVVAPVLTGEW